MSAVNWMRNVYDQWNDAAARLQGHSLTVKPSAADNILSMASKYVDPVTHRKALVSFYTPLPKGNTDVPAAVPKAGIMRGGSGSEWGLGSAFVVPLSTDAPSSVPLIVSDTRHVVTDVWNKIPFQPGNWLLGTWNTIKTVMGYVGFTYSDFLQQWRNWDKTMLGLVHNFDFMWRIFVTVLITFGAYELTTTIDAFGRILRYMWEAVTSIFDVSTSVLEEIWYILEKMWNSVLSFVK